MDKYFVDPGHYTRSAEYASRNAVRFYLASDVEPRIRKLESLLRRVNEWTPGLPAEASLQDEIAEALGL